MEKQRGKLFLDFLDIRACNETKICLNQLLTEERSYQAIDAQDFSAQTAYRQYWDDQPVMNGAYIVCYEERIVLLRPGTELTGAQMRSIAEKLKP